MRRNPSQPGVSSCKFHLRHAAALNSSSRTPRRAVLDATAGPCRGRTARAALTGPEERTGGDNRGKPGFSLHIRRRSQVAHLHVAHDTTSRSFQTLRFPYPTQTRAPRKRGAWASRASLSPQAPRTRLHAGSPSGWLPSHSLVPVPSREPLRSLPEVTPFVLRTHAGRRLLSGIALRAPATPHTTGSLPPPPAPSATSGRCSSTRAPTHCHLSDGTP